MNAFVYLIKVTFAFSEANFMKSAKELTNHDEEDLVNFHLALQPKYPNSTYIRDCVTIKPPPNAASGKDDQKVSSVFKKDNPDKSHANACLASFYPTGCNSL